MPSQQRLAVLVREVELDLGRQHGLEAALPAALDLAAQVVARIHRDAARGRAR